MSFSKCVLISNSYEPKNWTKSVCELIGVTSIGDKSCQGVDSCSRLLGSTSIDEDSCNKDWACRYLIGECEWYAVMVHFISLLISWAWYQEKPRSVLKVATGVMPVKKQTVSTRQKFQFSSYYISNLIVIYTKSHSGVTVISGQSCNGLQGKCTSALENHILSDVLLTLFYQWKPVFTQMVQWHSIQTRATSRMRALKLRV